MPGGARPSGQGLRVAGLFLTASLFRFQWLSAIFKVLLIGLRSTIWGSGPPATKVSLHPATDARPS
jgi:hypothetical protein